MSAPARAKTTAAPVLRYPGAKWSVAGKIVDLLPAHRVYLEPYFGSGAVLFSKRPSPVETINDADGEVANLFRVLRDSVQRAHLIEMVELTPWAEEELRAACEPDVGLDEVERARRLLVRCWCNVGARQIGAAHFRFAGPGSGSGDRPASVWGKLPARIAVAGKRLAGVQVLNRDAIDVIRAHAAPDVLVYCDPPYPLSTRTGAHKLYRHEMPDERHVELLEVLRAHPGPTVVSGYACDLYDSALADWRRVEMAGRGQRSVAKTEVLWLNPAAVRAGRMPVPERLW